MKKTEAIDYVVLARELVRCVRGEKSQGWMNKRMGYNRNVYYRFEAGYKKIYWHDFLEICAILKVDVEGALKLALYYGESIQGPALLRDIRKNHQNIGLEYFLEISASQLDLWCEDHAKIPLFIILKLISKSRHGLFNFLEAICDPLQLDSVHEVYKVCLARKKMAITHPMTSVVTAALEVKDYLNTPEHSDRVLAELTGMLEEEVGTLLEQLVEYQVLSKSGKHYVCNLGNMNTQSIVKGEQQKMLEYWVNRVLKYLPDNSQMDGIDSLNGFLIFNCSKEELEEVNRIMTDAFHNVRQTVNKKTPKKGADEVRLMNMNIIPLTKRIS